MKLSLNIGDIFFVYLKASQRISFGTRADRPTYPDEIPHDRFGNQHNPHRGVLNVGPGQYENHLKTAFTNQTKPMSIHGYVLGARTAQRNFFFQPLLGRRLRHIINIRRKRECGRFSNLSTNRTSASNRLIRS